MKITNTTLGDIGLQPDLVVPAQGSIEVEPDRLKPLGNLPSVVALFESGALVEDDAKPSAPKRPRRTKASKA